MSCHFVRTISALPGSSRQRGPHLGEIGPDHHGQHVDAGHQGRVQQHRHRPEGQKPPASGPQIAHHAAQRDSGAHPAGKSGSGDVPFADKACEQRDPRKGQAGHGQAAKGHRHPPAQSIQLIDMGLPGLVHHRAGTEKGADLHEGMEDHVAQGSRQPQGAHHGRAQQDIGQVADRGVGQPPLPVSLLCRHGRAICDRHHGSGHDHPLRPGILKETCAEAVVGQPQDRKGTGFHHSHRVEQGRHRRRRHRGRREPFVAREDHGFHPEPVESQQIDEQQQILMLTGRLKVQHAACRKGGVPRRRKVQNEHQAQKGEGRPADRIIQVFPAGSGRLSGEGEEHQREGGQRQELVEQIKGHQVPGQGDPRRDPIGHQVIGEKGGFPSLLLHVLKGVEHRQGPQDADQPGKHPSHPV